MAIVNSMVMMGWLIDHLLSSQEPIHAANPSMANICKASPEYFNTR